MIFYLFLRFTRRSLANLVISLDDLANYCADRGWITQAKISLTLASWLLDRLR